ncbi:alpha-hydroxy acid oxidase [Paraburkholderia sp. ZP32-5]|uniref:alpha-hydroxy acid oxidase n=1 Tax=Paraburkholderia sp. ZP32-5 TaxID=2883245 RepID=UPI001F291B09|nr:alpha-hydroxy acid oxidase [Paraburkholderia sp. ZP32-5]
MTNVQHRAYNINDLRELAKRRLPRGVFDFIDRGTEDDVALANNLERYQRIKLRPCHLVDVSNRNLQRTVFGHQQSMPLIIGPTGVADILWYEGELSLAKAATRAGIPFTLSTSSTTPLEKIFDATNGTMWMQTYLWEQRELSYAVIERAREAGVETLMLTVDTAVMPNREFNARNGFTNPFRLTPRMTRDIAVHPRWLFGVMGRYMLNGGVPRYANYPDGMGGKITGAPVRLANAASVTWRDVEVLRERWPRKLLVKGLLSAQDAVTAQQHGVDGVVLSNHGGRNLDSAMAPIDLLPEFRAALSKSTTLIVDSGIRRGSDVVKAIALGADAVIIGKAALYGLGAGGEAGVSHALSVFRDEIDRTLALVGRCSFDEVDASLIAASPR